MVGIVLVSHSKKLAMAIRELVLQMVGPTFPIAVAAGVGDDYEDLGTDAVHISEVLQPFLRGDGAVVFMDLGSAVLSAQTALELLDVPDASAKLRLCPAPMVEAAVAAAVQANIGGSLDEVVREARAALAAKQEQLEPTETVAPTEARANNVSSDVAQRLVEFDVVIHNPHGLHARPAAALVQSVSRFQSEVHLTNLTSRRGPSSARSLTSVSLLQARKGDIIRFSVRGRDADETCEALKQLAASRFGEGADEDVAPAGGAAIEPRRESAFGGIGASDGIAIGRPLALRAALPLPEEGEPGLPEAELELLRNALEEVSAEMMSNAQKAGGDILAAQSLILRDPVLLDAVRVKVSAGSAAARAWREESEHLATSYSELEDEYMRARAADVRDISVRVLRAIAGEHVSLRIQPDPPAILMTGELLPSEAMACDPKHVLGVLATAGSATAHAAIIMRTLGIPLVVGASGAGLTDLRPTALLAIDGTSGEVWIDPPESELNTILARQRAQHEQRASVESAKQEPAFTRDGHRIEVLANVGNAADAVQASKNGSEGVGLLRTEFVYLGHKQMPTEDQQVASLAEVLLGVGPGPVVIRTPDVGADKPLPYLTVAEEHNPFLGVRGLRLSFRHPDFFRSNIKAILRAAIAGGVVHDVWVMFPMVTSPEEMQQARVFAQDAHAELERSGVEHMWPVKLGMMVEVPAAALLAERFAKLADFFSIGTNDLTQYVLASERGNADLTSLQDTAHPAVLRIIQQICAAADKANCHVSVCGDAASDPLVAALMMGLGVRSLSVRPNQVATIKALVRKVSMIELRQLGIAVLDLDNGSESRKLAAAGLFRQE